MQRLWKCSSQSRTKYRILVFVSTGSFKLAVMVAGISIIPRNITTWSQAMIPCKIRLEDSREFRILEKTVSIYIYYPTKIWTSKKKEQFQLSVWFARFQWNLRSFCYKNCPYSWKSDFWLSELVSFRSSFLMLRSFSTALYYSSIQFSLL